eukprot:scaffold11736_cov186-Skeletonema_dohrnii-CCMP3373.AAC.2
MYKPCGRQPREVWRFILLVFQRTPLQSEGCEVCERGGRWWEQHVKCNRPAASKSKIYSCTMTLGIKDIDCVPYATTERRPCIRCAFCISESRISLLTGVWSVPSTQAERSNDPALSFINACHFNTSC